MQKQVVMRVNMIEVFYMQCMYENRMTPVKNYSKGDSGVRQSNRGG
jgi:hypothetical protein